MSDRYVWSEVLVKTIVVPIPKTSLTRLMDENRRKAFWFLGKKEGPRKPLDQSGCWGICIKKEEEN